jgi:hypothetical protein
LKTTGLIEAVQTAHLEEIAFPTVLPQASKNVIHRANFAGLSVAERFENLS